MKSSAEVVTHVVEVIENIYKRPAMYARTPSGLDALLFQYHHVWGYILERSDWMQANAELHDGLSVTSEPADFHQPVRSEDISRFQPIIEHWRHVDERIGLGPI